MPYHRLWQYRDCTITQVSWVLALVLLLTCKVTLSKSLPCSEPSILHLSMWGLDFLVIELPSCLCVSNFMSPTSREVAGISYSQFHHSWLRTYPPPVLLLNLSRTENSRNWEVRNRCREKQQWTRMTQIPCINWAVFPGEQTSQMFCFTQWVVLFLSRAFISHYLCISEMQDCRFYWYLMGGNVNSS